MDNRTKGPGPRPLPELAYDRGNRPKEPLPGPLFDLSVVGLLLFLAIGYALS